MDRAEKETLLKILLEYEKVVKFKLSTFMGIVTVALSNVSVIKPFQEKLETISSVKNVLNDKRIKVFDSSSYVDPSTTARNILLNIACKGARNTFDKITELIENNGGKYYYINTLSGVVFDKHYVIDKDIELVNRDEFPKELLVDLNNSIGNEYRYELGGPINRCFAGLLYTGTFNIEEVSKDEEDTISTDSISYKISKKMNLIALLIPLLSGRPCHQLHIKSYLDKNVLLWAGEGSAKALPEFNIITCNKISMDENKMEQYLSYLLNSDENKRQFIEERLRHYNIARIRQNDREQALELRLLIEMLLLNGENSGEISETISLRGSWLLGKTVDERRTYYTILKKAYSLSSSAVHGNYKEKAVNKKIIEDFFDICKKILITFMESSFIPRTRIEWQTVVLGGLAK